MVRHLYERGREWDWYANACMYATHSISLLFLLAQPLLAQPRSYRIAQLYTIAWKPSGKRLCVHVEQLLLTTTRLWYSL